MSHLRQFFWTFIGLLSFWRRNPISCITLILGLGVATALWSGVQALNAEARKSYQQATATLGGDQFQSITPVNGGLMNQQVFIDLRRKGWRVSPIVEGQLRLEKQRLQIIGIDPVTLPDPDTTENNWLSEFEDTNTDLLAFLNPPFRAFANPATIADLSAGSDATRLPQIFPLDNLPPRTVLTDIGVAQKILGFGDEISRLIVDERQKKPIEVLRRALDGSLQLQQPQQDNDLDALTNSFHLNLTAFGFLSFVVGLFIVNSAVGLAFEHRKSMVRTFRACGVSARMLMYALLAELLLFALISGALGIFAGYLIASALLPDVAASLDGLYGANVAGSLTLKWQWWVAGLSIAVLGAVFAAGINLLKLVKMPILANAHPVAWREAGTRLRKWQLVAACTLALVALVTYLWGGSLLVGFVLMGAVLLASALFLPTVLATLLGLLERRSSKPLSQWFWADSVQQMSGLSLALMALLLALAINVGVGTMVQSFRSTFLGWLDQRLAADVYLNAGTEERGQQIRVFLETQPGVKAVLPIWNTKGQYRDFPIEIYGFRNHALYQNSWPLLNSTKNVWDEVARGDGILISEQLARRFDLSIDNVFQLKSDMGDLSFPIAGIYSDYGNPIGQVMISVETLSSSWPSAEKSRFGLILEPTEKSNVIQALSDEFALSDRALVDQKSLKDMSKSIFEKTFAVTLALNALTLFVAGIAMLTNLLTLSQMRLPQLAPIWAMGLTRKKLALIELVKALALALLTAICALPLGLTVAWILLDVINVEAFGWRIPLSLFPIDWIKLLGLTLLTALLAAAYPSYKLRHMPPSDLLKVFANER